MVISQGLCSSSPLALFNKMKRINNTRHDQHVHIDLALVIDKS